MAGLFKNVLCAVDFDENCGAALEAACNVLAEDGFLYVFHAVSFRFALTTEEAVLPLYEAKERLEKIVRAQVGAKARYEVVVESSEDTANSILQAAARRLTAGCIVIATHGRKGVDRFLLGSVAEPVVRESSCPVLTIRPLTAGHSP